MTEMPVVFDKSDYYYEDALQVYCEVNEKEEASLTDDDHEKIMKYACVHIAFYMTWIIRKGQLGDMHKEDPRDAADAEKVKNGEISGIDYLMKYCDGRLYPEDMTNEMAEFTAKFYEKNYWKVYVSFVTEELCDLPFEFEGGWEDYLEFEPVLDSIYESEMKR